MNFTNYIYVPCLLLLVFLYYHVRKSWQWILLLVASILFYSTWDWRMIYYAITATAVSFLLARIIDARYERGDSFCSSMEFDRKQTKEYMNGIRKGNHLLLWIGILPVLGALVFSKVMTVTVESFVPALGISYFTLSLIGYLADVYWRKESSEHNPLKLLLFTLYFPKIVTGPISKHRIVAPQLNAAHDFNYRRLTFGLQRMLWGYFKKLVIADRLNIYVTKVIAEPSIYNGSYLLVAGIFSAFVMYTDFSGSIDMVLGASEIFGIDLEENFNHPFFAQSAAEFWRRWHMSLSTWFKDYMFLPISRMNIVKKLSKLVGEHFGAAARKNTILLIASAFVWLATALWHGSGRFFLVWGAYWWFLINASTVFAPQLTKLTQLLRLDPESKGYQRFRMIRTFMIFVISRLIVLPGSFRVTLLIFQRILFNFGAWHLVNGDLYKLGLDRPNFLLGVTMLFMLWFVSRKQEEGTVIREEIAGMPIVARWIFYLAAILFVLIFGVYGAGYNASSFVYQDF